MIKCSLEKIKTVELVGVWNGGPLILTVVGEKSVVWSGLCDATAWNRLTLQTVDLTRPIWALVALIGVNSTPEESWLRKPGVNWRWQFALQLSAAPIKSRGFVVLKLVRVTHMKGCDKQHCQNVRLPTVSYDALKQSQPRVLQWKRATGTSPRLFGIKTLSVYFHLLRVNLKLAFYLKSLW